MLHLRRPSQPMCMQQLARDNIILEWQGRPKQLLAAVSTYIPPGMMSTRSVMLRQGTCQLSSAAAVSRSYTPT